MKKLILLALISTFAISGFVNESQIKAKKEAKENDRLCKIFTNKVETYKSSMRNDSLADATLTSYEKRMDIYCSAPREKIKVQTVKEALNESNTDLSSKEYARLCNIFTDKAEKYELTMRDDALAKHTLSSYKERMSGFCKASAVRS